MSLFFRDFNELAKEQKKDVRKFFEEYDELFYEIQKSLNNIIFDCIFIFFISI